MKRYDEENYLNNAIEIAKIIKKIPKIAGWTSTEYKQLKGLLIKGFYSNLETAKTLFKEDVEE